jgi:hypothetical protein
LPTAARRLETEEIGMSSSLWKASTLVLAGALALVVSRGSVAQAQACDSIGPAFEEARFEAQARARAMARTQLVSAISTLDQLEDQLEATPRVSSDRRDRALGNLALARTELRRELAQLNPRPRPRHRAPQATFESGERL